MGSDSSRQIFASTAIAVGPVNGGCPVRHSNSTQPSENMSARASISFSPRACSGAMYIGVPMMPPASVMRRGSNSRRARPKSSSFASSRRPPGRKRLLGLMSR